MSSKAFVHWDKENKSLHINFRAFKPVKMKADLYDGRGKCILNLIDTFSKTGEISSIKKIEDISNGFYVLKFFCDDKTHVIRFKV